MIKACCDRLGFPHEATEVLHRAYQRLIADPVVAADLKTAEEKLHTPWDDDWEEYLQDASNRSGIARETVDMVLLLMAIEPLKKKYQENNLPEQLMWETMMDLTCKLLECKNVRGIWGTFVPGWFKGFYVLDRFKLGRLEYEKVPFRLDKYQGWKKGDTVINCHIPSAGPLAREAVMDSLRYAHDFYKDTLKDGVMLLTCHSWLLYPGHYEHVFPEGSNLQKFYELFTNVGWNYQKDNGDFWRIFNVDYSPEVLNRVPTDTTLRRNLLNYVKNGNQMGDGLGIILFDGEKII